MSWCMKNRKRMIAERNGFVFRKIGSHRGFWLIELESEELTGLFSSKRATRSSKNQLFHSISVLTLQALEQSAVLAVYRQDGRARFPGPPHHQLARHHQCLLVRQGDVLPRRQRRQRRCQTGEPRQRSHDDVHRVG